MAFDLSNAVVYPPAETVSDKIAKYVDMINFITSTKITSGFDYTVDGTEYHFSYDSDDQMNFSLMSTSATASIELGLKYEAEGGVANLIALYDADDGEGGLDESKLPAALPGAWTEAWQGHKDGLSHTLFFTPSQFLKLSKAGGDHIKACFTEGWTIKYQLQACTTIQDLTALVSSLGLEQSYSDYTLLASS